jgi:ABC-type transport system involved in Fe-S cluster assembly fused permease/ATPase subunit
MALIFADLTGESLRGSIGVVMQDSHLFHDSIIENLRYAKADATIQEMESACRSAQIWDLIESLPNGLKLWSENAAIVYLQEKSSDWLLQDYFLNLQVS